MAGCDKQVSFCLSPYCQQVQTDLSRARKGAANVKMNTKHSSPTADRNTHSLALCYEQFFSLR